MTARHYVIGLVLWLGLLYFGAKWAVKPFISLYSYIGGNAGAVEMIKRNFPIRLASLPDPVPPDSVSVDEEGAGDDSVLSDWKLRETRNRVLLVFFFWVASGFTIHWVVKRIVCGEVDYT